MINNNTSFIKKQGGLAFSLSIFLSAFLLFMVQPLLAKKLLPTFGGSPSVWLCIVVFFQITLLMGYLYAFFLTKLSKPTLQALIHFLILGTSLIFLPLTPLGSVNNDLWGPIGVFSMLSTSVLLPILVISSTSPLLQHWYCRAYQTDFPYRYYALSNLGSLLGLLTFPFIIEPYVGLHTQLLGWSLFYGGFIVSCLFCLVIAAKQTIAAKSIPLNPIKDSSVNKKTILIWLLLTALSCALLLSTTQLMMQNIVGFPLLWLIPLTLYLLSFILTFSYPKTYYRPLWISLYSILACGILLLSSHHQLLLSIQLLVFALLLFSGCMICHGELIRLKPHPHHLTFYYLIIALGGVLGGLFVNVLSPMLFNEWWDFYLSLLGIMILLGVVHFYYPKKVLSGKWIWLEYGWIGILFIISTLLCYQLIKNREDVIINHRNFFGKSEIIERNPNSFLHQRLLRNGKIIHGHQFLAPEKRHMATTYFSPQSGIGLAMGFERQRKIEHALVHKGLHIGVIGLGTGTIAALGQIGDFIRFYEIDPDIHKMAKQYFSYLDNSPAVTEVTIDDGRIALTKALQSGPLNFDIIAIDAFNGDAIPLHLLTLEAMKVYLSHLKPDGIIAFHISSRYVDLYPPLEALAHHLGLYSYIAHNLPDDHNWVFSAEWVLMSRKTDIGLYLFQHGALAFNDKRMNKVWTDDHNYLLSVVKW